MAAQKNLTSRCIWVLNLGCKAGFLGRVRVSPIPKILKRGREVEQHSMFGGDERRGEEQGYLLLSVFLFF